MAAAGELRLERMIDILTALGEPASTGDSGLGGVRIAGPGGREKSQVSRALRTLAGTGLVERDAATREYRLGWRLFALAARVGDQRLLALSPPVLHGLVGTLGGTAHLTVLDGVDVVTVLSEASPSVVRAIEWTGRAVPAHSTSAGRALLLDHDAASLRGLFAGRELAGARAGGAGARGGGAGASWRRGRPPPPHRRGARARLRGGRRRVRSGSRRRR